MKKFILLSINFFGFSFFLFAQKNFIQYVNPFIGTQKMGHTFPGATVPFGAVQLSPDTDTIPMLNNGKYVPEVYQYCAGYNYDDKTIVGFSHTHFSGTGHSDLGDFLIMPTVGNLQLNPGTANNPASGFRSSFSHKNETASPNYYSVLLDDDNIKAELTTSSRVGMHRYHFPKTDSAHIILDLMHGIYNYPQKNVWTYLRIENDSTVTGFRQTNGWARTRTVYFAMQFNKKFKNYGVKNFEPFSYNGFWRKFDQSKNFPEAAGKQLRAYFDFDTNENEFVLIKFAISPVSTKNALQNMEQEIPDWNFDAVVKNGQQLWNKELSKVDAEFLTNDDRINFYTAMYHAALSPSLYMDVNKEYKGLDQNVYKANDFTNYTTFSLWDTYRALHPWLNLINKNRNEDMIESMLAHQQQSAEKMLPIWSHYANENWCMSGYHSVSVICDAIVNGNESFDAQKALEACVQTARTKYYDGLEDYMKLGYVPEDKVRGVSVSNTLEFAYDDWCIAQAAKKLGNQEIYQEFIRRSANWKTLFDPSIGFMRTRLLDGTFKKDFDPMSTHDQGFIEGNAWNFSFFVPQDPNGLMNAMGGAKKFEQKLDTLFNMHLPDQFFAETEDITREGIIGGYVHGNEPAHHVAYLYNFAGVPYKTQAMIRKILPMQYKPTPDGLGGNDDCGQMSAWYIFSALGFYPFAPASGNFQIGSPLIKNATLSLDNGNQFIIQTKNQSSKNIYVQSIKLNGKKLDRNFILYYEISNGGKLEFEMGVKPKK